MKESQTCACEEPTMGIGKCLECATDDHEFCGAEGCPNAK